MITGLNSQWKGGDVSYVGKILSRFSVQSGILKRTLRSESCENWVSSSEPIDVILTYTAWARYVQDINVWLNVTTHSITRYTPYELNYGKLLTNKIKTLIQFPPETSEPHEIKIEIANERTHAAFEKRKTRQNFCRDP